LLLDQQRLDLFLAILLTAELSPRYNAQMEEYDIKVTDN